MSCRLALRERQNIDDVNAAGQCLRRSRQGVESRRSRDHEPPWRKVPIQLGLDGIENHGCFLEFVDAYGRGPRDEGRGVARHCIAYRWLVKVDHSNAVTTSGSEEPYDSWGSPYGASGPKPREGAWDPVRDWQFMGHNVKRFMKIWECPKPVLGQIHGWAIGGATDMILCCDLLFMASDAYIGYAPSRIYGTPTTMMWVYRLGLEHAKQFLLSGDAIDAETAHRIGLVAYVYPPDELGNQVEAFARRLAHIPANQLALNKLLVNQAFENMGLRTSQLLGTLLALRRFAG